ncbi:hypothetical protein [Rhizobium mesoamericanum]|uniref:hypothetical protein n=1 Tax=Rhizobium mesoamericanum TaxID=1079800 RepID=UPI0002ED35E4
MTGTVETARHRQVQQDGAAGFFTPRPLPPFFSSSGSIEAESFYDVAPLKATLERLVDFDRINSGAMWLAVSPISMVWSLSNDNDPANRWMRSQVGQLVSSYG